MSEFDDPELERLLGRTAGAYPDVNVAYERVQGRVRQVKRRRAVVVSGAACALLFAGVVYASTANGTTNRVQPGGGSSPSDSNQSPDLSIEDSTDMTITTSVPPTTGMDGATTVPTGNTTAVTTSGTSGAGSTGGTGTVATTPAATAPVATNPPPTNPAPTNPPATSPPATNAPVVTTTFSGVGGSITVRLENGSLTLLSSPANSGFTAAVNKSSGSRVEVEFESAGNRTRIRVDLVGGEMSPEIREW